MVAYSVNRSCPFSCDANIRELAVVRAGDFCRSNTTYKSDYEQILSLKSGDTFPIVECTCGFIFAGWLPPDEFLGKVYESVIDHSKTQTDTLTYRKADLDHASVLLDVAARSFPNRPLKALDFGCGYGNLLSMIGSKDIECVGYEPSEQRCQIVQNRGILACSNLSTIEQKGPFDLVVCTEVLEHVADPFEVLGWIRRVSSPRTILLTTVPHCDQQFMQRSLKSYQETSQLHKVINPWEHLNYFSQQSFCRLLKACGFNPQWNLESVVVGYSQALKLGSGQWKDLLKYNVKSLANQLKRSASTQWICTAQ